MIYALGADSLPQAGVPRGQVTKHAWRASRVYPGATHDYWVYVPAQYTGEPSAREAREPACVMVFQDGFGYLSPEGSVRAPTVFDNLIHQGAMPATIGVFVNPGSKAQEGDQRERQYTPRTDAYARFLLEEILPQVGREHRLADHAAGRAICGWSDGGLAAFTAAWERPDAFGKVLSHVGSFTRLPGGGEYPSLVRKTRGNPKPIRAYLQDGENDINLTEGSWTLANLAMASALMFARYDHRFELGTGGHDLLHGGAVFPDALRWLWRDYPGVVGADRLAAAEAVAGTWDVETNVLGEVRRSVLEISAVGASLARGSPSRPARSRAAPAEGSLHARGFPPRAPPAEGSLHARGFPPRAPPAEGSLSATLTDEVDGEIELAAFAFEDGILRYEYPAPPSQARWGKGVAGTMEAWLQVRGDTLHGALSNRTLPVMDYATRGRRRGAKPPV